MRRKESLEQIRDHSRPAGLVAGADAAPAVTVEVLVKRDVIAPLRIGLKGRIVAEDRPAALPVTQKDGGDERRPDLRQSPLFCP